MRFIPRLISGATLIFILSTFVLVARYDHAIKPDSLIVIPTPIYVGERIALNETRWSVDSQILWFSGLDRTSQQYAYNVQTSQVTPLDQSPFLIHFTQEQQVQLEAIDDEAYLSPDGQYVIYKHVDKVCGESGCQNRWALGSLQTGQHTLIRIGILISHWVVWSADSHSALFIGDGAYGGLGGVYHLAQFFPSVDQIQSTQLMNFQTGNHAYVDISPDGTRVLLREMAYGRETGLYVWDSTQLKPQQFSAKDSPIIFEDETVAGAAFVADDLDVVLTVTDAGIVRLNMQTNETVVINPEINASWVEWSYFSSDKRLIAVIPRVTDGFSCKLFVLPVGFSGDVQTMLEQAQHCSFYG